MAAPSSSSDVESIALLPLASTRRRQRDAIGRVADADEEHEATTAATDGEKDAVSLACSAKSRAVAVAAEGRNSLIVSMRRESFVCCL